MRKMGKWEEWLVKVGYLMGGWVLGLVIID
jgi:hypothetical protein